MASIKARNLTYYIVPLCSQRERLCFTSCCSSSTNNNPISLCESGLHATVNPNRLMNHAKWWESSTFKDLRREGKEQFGVTVTHVVFSFHFCTLSIHYKWPVVIQPNAVGKQKVSIVYFFKEFNVNGSFHCDLILYMYSIRTVCVLTILFLQ